MTVTAEQPDTGLGLAELVSRTESLIKQRERFAGWWVELASLLDGIGARAVGLRTSNDGTAGLAEQLRMDAPHLFQNFRRLEDESDALSAEILTVRMATGVAAGTGGDDPEIPRKVKSVLRRLRRLESRTNSLMLEAYERDIGGE